jgi:hypothetical protein
MAGPALSLPAAGHRYDAGVPSKTVTVIIAFPPGGEQPDAGCHSVKSHGDALPEECVLSVKFAN